ncbi:TonB-dependent receptor plug domain-containing protein [Thauera sp. Sel9]|uniref:TonB-dependent receptor plug domain-containing protein n=1 Tax=Thauera sp. Sel9 TaxID=2974299 RepID=UPI0021E19699|nr:TonB-dependent receptor [Thauera sp. Sel9]MCV2219366.1 TonB-dependent receptor [Thauera sp. Sel9]
MKTSIPQGLRSALALSGAALCQPLWAVTPTVTLNSVVIEAPSVETTTTAELAQFGSKTEIVTREQIERAGPSADVARVLQMYVPGLFIAPKNGPFDYTAVSLLGGRTDDTLILLDGVRLNNRLYGGIYIDTLPAAAVERIEVLKGGQSLFFGTQAISGVINIVTRRAQSREYSGQASLGVDTFGGINAEGRVERVFENGLGAFEFLAFASHNESDGYEPYRRSDTTATLSKRKRAYEVTTVGAKLAQNFGSNARAELFYQYTDADLDFARPTQNRDTRNVRDHHILTATFEHAPSDSFRYFVKGHFNKWDTDYTRVYNLPGGGISVINDKDYWGFKDWGVQAQATAVLPGAHELVFGVDSQRYRARDDITEVHDHQAEAYGAYVQFRPVFKSMPQWQPAVGVRHEKMSGGGSATVWNLSSRYQLDDQWALRGQIGTAFKLPTAYQLYSFEDGLLGNTGLKPERSRNIELGFDWVSRSSNLPLRLSSTVFKRKVEDLISVVGGQYNNSKGEIDVKGIEFDGQFQLTRNWGIGGDYTRTISEAQNGSRLTGVPAWMARARVNFDSNDARFGGEVAWRFIADIAHNATVEYGRYAVVDASAYYYLDAARSHKLSLLVENLFDRDYGTALITNGSRLVPQLGRPLNAELRYTYRF